MGGCLSCLTCTEKEDKLRGCLSCLTCTEKKDKLRRLSIMSNMY